MKGNKLGNKVAAAAKSSSKGNQEGRQAWKRRRQGQPRAARMEIMKRQGGSGITTIKAISVICNPVIEK